jgi:hypothetical protein
VAPDDQRFLMIEPRGIPGARGLVVVENFSRVLDERVGR